MRILLLTPDFPPARGGIQTWMLELARGLPDAEVTVFAPSMPGDRVFDTTSGCRVRRLRGAQFRGFRGVAQLAVVTLAFCVARRPHLIVCGHVTAAPVALLARQLLRVPYVVFVYGYELRRRRFRGLKTLLLRRAARVIACSRFTSSLVQELGVPSALVHVLYPGVDPTHFTPSPPGVRRPGTERKTILTVSRLKELYKGHDTMLRALPLIKAKAPGVRYVIAGDGPLRAYLSNLAQSIGTAQDVDFLGDVPDANLPDVYRSCDVLVQVSRQSPALGSADGFGIVCLEAAACARAVVAGRSGGLPDAVEDGVTGILVDPVDVGAVSEAVIAILGDADLARRLGSAGRERAAGRFTWTQMAAEARSVFAAAAGKSWAPVIASSS